MNQNPWKSWWGAYVLASGPFAMLLGGAAILGVLLQLFGYEDFGPEETRPLTDLEEFMRPAMALSFPILWFCCAVVTKLRLRYHKLVFFLNCLPLSGLIWVYSQPPDYDLEMFPEDQQVALFMRAYLCIVLAILSVWYLDTRKRKLAQ